MRRMLFTLCADSLRMRPCERDAVSAKPRRGLTFGGRLAATALVALSAMGSFADAKSAWFADHSFSWVTLTNTITVNVGSETPTVVHTKDLLKNGITSKNLGGGVTLVLTDSIWTLRMSGNVSINGIDSKKSIAIELMPGSFTHITAPRPYTDTGNNKSVYGIYCEHGLLIHGSGALSVSHLGSSLSSQGCGIAIRYCDLLITGGASVRVQTAGVPAIEAGKNGDGTSMSDLSVIGALLETTGGRVWSRGNMLLDRAVVNILSLGEGVNAWGNLTMGRSFCASMAREGTAISTRKVLNLDNTIVYALSKEDTCVKVLYDTSHEPSLIGKGLYKFATLGGTGKSAFEFNLPMKFEGGVLVTCAPGGYGMRSTSYDFAVNSGLIRNQYSMNLKNEFFVSRELMDAYDFIVGWEALEYETEFNPYNEIELFIGYTMLDWIEAQGIETPSGDAYAAIATASFCLNGGTILPEASEMGVIVNKGSGGTYWEPTVKGGSLRGPIGYYDIYAGGYNEMCAVSEQPGTWRADGTPEYALVCVTNRVAGEPYSRVTSGWTAKLPSGYDTSSLYLDGENKLYFWVPEEYAKKSLQSACDLGFYVPTSRGWTDSLFVTSVSGGTSPMTTIEQGKQIFLYYGFKNLTGNSDLTGFFNRFALSTGAVFDNDWTASTLHAGRFGWGGESFSPQPLQNLAPGTYTLTCTLDATDALAETNEGNNTKSITFRIVAPGSGGGSGGGGFDPVKVYCSVVFNENGGGRGLIRSVRIGEVVGTLPVPTRSGYSFDGWWTAKSGGFRVTAETKVTASVTYYAHWRANGSSGGGSGGDGVIGGRISDMTFAKAQTVLGALYGNGDLVGSVQVKAGKINVRKDTVKFTFVATVLADGKAKKITVKAVLRNASQVRSAPHREAFSFKAPIGAMTFVLNTDGTFTLSNNSYAMRKATVGGALKSGSLGTFRLKNFNLAVPGELQDALLPYEETFSIAGTRWQFARATAARWAKDGATGDVSKALLRGEDGHLQGGVQGIRAGERVQRQEEAEEVHGEGDRRCGEREGPRRGFLQKSRRRPVGRDGGVSLARPSRCGYSITTLVPTSQSSRRRTAFQLERRKQPCDSARPICSGQGVPWMP